MLIRQHAVLFSAQFGLGYRRFLVIETSFLLFLKLSFRLEIYGECSWQSGLIKLKNGDDKIQFFSVTLFNINYAGNVKVITGHKVPEGE